MTQSTNVEQAAAPCCPIVELRQYTLKPGRRETLIELFEREFIESQEAVGMRIIGTFRDLENPDRFVWLRGFQDMESRAAQLQEFYGGPVWKSHREAANATMIDSDNVLLLRPATARSGFALAGATRPARSAAETAGGVFGATLYHLERGTESDFAQFFQNTIAPILTSCGIRIVASFVTEHHPNTFPALPVREDANVFIWFTRFAEAAASDAMSEIAPEIADRIKGKPEVLYLAPTARSLLRA
jgi:quinol monooxygenase YgiN